MFLRGYAIKYRIDGNGKFIEFDIFDDISYDPITRKFKGTIISKLGV